jgi:hypothetical protein
LTGAAAPPSAVLFDDLENVRGPVGSALSGDRHVTLAPGQGVGGGQALRVAYIGGTMGSERVVRTIPLPERGREYTLNYDVKFESDFQFVQGGKMHGLGPEHMISGGDVIEPNGWSARVMWRKDGRPVTYTYHQDQGQKYGTDGPTLKPVTFQPGRWHAVSLHVRVNDPVTSRNGFVRMYLDGVLVSREEPVRLRASEPDKSLISRLLFSTFHGGNDPSWAPRTADGGYGTVHALFDNFAVERGERVRTAPGG